ncbi:hypothetical protein LCGC14_2620930 [marine sediment metagenome]|uniref:Uncharacterized protein n=1 Tax=marine sediment metagenome TaxID=412755 RepID=A0A0F9CVM2_9ZZZZ
MKFTVMERFVLSSILPAEESFATLKLVRKAKENLSFNDIENQKLNIRQDGEQVIWDMQAAIEVDKNAAEVELGDTVTQLVVEALKKLDSEKKLKDEHFSLFEKFCI